MKLHCTLSSGCPFTLFTFTIQPIHEVNYTRLQFIYRVEYPRILALLLDALQDATRERGGVRVEGLAIRTHANIHLDAWERHPRRASGVKGESEGLLLTVESEGAAFIVICFGSVLCKGVRQRGEHVLELRFLPNASDEPLALLRPCSAWPV